MAALVVVGVLLVLGVVYLVDWLMTKDDLARGTSIGGVDVGGLSQTDAVDRLRGELGALDEPFTVRVHDTAVQLDPASAGLAVDLAASVDRVGTRSANPLTRIGALLGRTDERPVVATVVESALTESLVAVAAKTDVSAVEGQVSLAGITVTAVAPVNGAALNVPASAAAITQAWTGGRPRDVWGLDLPVDARPVRADPDETAAAATEITTLMSAPLKVTAGTTTVDVPRETIAAAVKVAPDSAAGFTVTIDQAALRAAYEPQVDATATAPANAGISIVDGAPVVTPAVDGRSIDWTATDAALSPALHSADHVLTVVYQSVPAAISTAAVQELGIKEVIGEFSTGGFKSDSGQNVKRTAEQVQGAIVQPGDVFSLNGYTGPRGAAQGYVEAGIIENGVAARGIGGGISQFATTLFNASYFAGMQDVEHKAHSYYISRYPAGREATVFEAEDGSSVIDVKFKNVSANAVLIQTVWTPSTITVRIWGTKFVDVESIPGDRYNFTPAPTRTIPYGEKCSPTSGSTGFSIDVTKVTRDLAGKEISRKTSTTVYNGQVKISCEPPPPPPVTETPTPPATTSATAPATGG